MDDVYDDNGLYGATVPTAIQVISNTVGPSLCRQEFSDECDINVIMRGYETGKAWPGPLPGVEPVYVDWADMPDNLMDAMDKLKSAGEAFMSLSANVRKEFDNDPVKFVDFCSDPSSLGKLREWGLAPPVPEEPVVAPAAPVSSGGAPVATGGAPPAAK